MASRHPASSDAHQRKNRSDRGQREWIACVRLIQQVLEQSSARQRRANSGEQAVRNRLKALAQNHPAERGRFGAESKSDTEFACPLRHVVGGDTVDA